MGDFFLSGNSLRSQIEAVLEGYGLDVHRDPVQKTVPKLKQHGLHERAINETSFLDDSVSFSQRLWHVFNMPNNKNICKNGEEPKFDSFFRGYFVGCGRDCACVLGRKSEGVREYYSGIDSEALNSIVEKRNKTNLEKYGVANPSKSEEVKERIKRTNKEKYGTEYASQNKDVRDRVRNTCLERHGAASCFESDEIKDKIADTMIERYGASNPMQSEKVRKSIKEKNLQKHGVEFVSHVLGAKDKIKRKHLEHGLEKYLERLSESEYKFHNLNEYNGLGYEYDFVHSECGEVFSDKITYDKPLPNCSSCYPKRWASSEGEKELFEFVKGFCEDAISNDKSVISPKELDIYIPSKELAIEYCGLWWHGERNGKDKWYHFNKWKWCKEKGIRLITIWDSEWQFKQGKVKDRLSHILGGTGNVIGARKCNIRELSSEKAKSFCEKYHLHGYTKSSVKYGAFLGDELIGVMTFGKRKITGVKTSEWEIMRFCVGENVVGLAGKFVKRFVRDHEPSKLISYSDNRWDSGEVYKKLGFVQTNKPQPNYWYTSNYLGLEHRYKFTKKRLTEQGADASLSESMIMKELGYDKVWDCGVVKWELDLNKK